MKQFEVVLTYPIYAYHVVEAKDEEQAKHLALEGEGFYKSFDGEYEDDIEITEVDL